MGNETMNDTICALATAPGGAINMIRVSGPDALNIVSPPYFNSQKRWEANTIHYTTIVGVEGEPIDDAMVATYHAPHSYTGEDAAEITCHGSSYIAHKILDLLIHQGCRMALPGEFTQRAFLNNKMDLSQAEAVADLIASNNRATHRLAISQLRGGISSELAQLREQLLRLASLLELELDFSDHEDLEFADRKELLHLAETIQTHVARMARSFETGQALKQGIPVAIVGKTNVGKSTLLNRLLKDERAIVSDIHGTTRDTIEDTIELNGVTFRFIDTAGLRETSDEVEQIGIERTYQAIEKARIVLWVVDNTPSAEELQHIHTCSKGKSLLLIRNKIDIETPTGLPIDTLCISAKNDKNLDALEQAIYAAAHLSDITSEDVVVTNARHYEALTHAGINLKRFIEGLNAGLSGDLLAEDLKIVLSNLADITGKGIITPQETLNTIFSVFCIGK